MKQVSVEPFSSTTLDKMAVFLSGVCIVHCLVTPILVTLLPIVALSALAEDILFHRMMLWLVLPTSCIALFIGCRKHRNLNIVATGVTGMLMLTAIAFFGHELFESWGEKVATSVAGLVLAYSHILNYRACRKTTCDDENCSTDHHH
ncbi:MAG: MerC domain-containing protein [Arenicella sp.]|nr:MerC domain-containing protein [Arenicella sp.]